MPRCPFVGGEQISFHIGVGSDRYSVSLPARREWC